MRQKNDVMMVLVYVDDLLVAIKCEEDVNYVKAQIADRVEVVDKGAVRLFLNMEVERENPTGTISLSQQSYIRKLVSEYGMEDSRPVATPLEPKFQGACQNAECGKADPVKYQSLIGSLMYISVCTRPDISHSVSKLSQFNNNPHIEHFNAAKRIIRYLAKTQSMKIVYKHTGEPVKCYVDADWGGDSSDRKSYTG